MKRSVAMMACVLSGALMISAVTVRLFLRKQAEKTAGFQIQMKQRDESEKDKEDTSKVEVLEDGTYSAEFDTDSSHVSCK